MARRGRGGGKKEKLRGIRPVRAIKPTRKLAAISRFGSVFRPRSMAAFMDRYAREQDRLAGQSPPEPPHTPAPRPQSKPVSARSEPASLWQRLWAWLFPG